MHAHDFVSDVVGGCDVLMCDVCASLEYMHLYTSYVYTYTYTYT